MSISVSDDVTQSSLLEALATKKMDLLAQVATWPAVNLSNYEKEWPLLSASLAWTILFPAAPNHN
jgi:hypothetical protein